VDSGTDLNFIDRDFLVVHRIPATKLRHPIPLHLADGRHTTQITHFVRFTLLFNCFEEEATFAVYPLGTQTTILGLPWLRQFKPRINWSKGRVRAYASRTNPEGPLPDVAAISLLDCHSFTQAMAKGDVGAIVAAALVGGPLADPKDCIPHQFRDFSDVFSEDNGRSLPPNHPFDHRINLEPGTSPPFGLIYKLSPAELQVLHDYIQDNLTSGAIAPSESSASAPILFVKKKDGSLRLCIDY